MEKSASKLTPRYWPSWLLVGLMWLLARLPIRLGTAITGLLGPLMLNLMKSRRRIARRNIEACFPELDSDHHERLVRQCFQSLAVALGEMAYTWAGNRSSVMRSGEVVGLEHLAAARQGGRGVLLVTCHMTCLDIGGRIFAENIDNHNFAAVYRPLKNPVMEWFQNQGRGRFTRQMISKRDARNAVRHLRAGGMLWYAPDQDFGPEQSDFAPFFGIQTAVLSATHRLALLGQAAIVPMFPRRLPNGRYQVTVMPAIAGVPSDDRVADLTRINQVTEQFIRQAPEQYWWVHRRFKTRPPGEDSFYP